MCCPPVRQLGPPHLSLSCFLHSWQYHLPAQGGRWQQCVTSPTDGRCASRAAALQRALRPGTGWSIICAPPPGSCVLACHLPLGRFSSVSPTQPKWNHSYGQSATAENGRCMVQLATEPARRGLVNKPPSWSAQRPAVAAAAAAAAVHAPGFSHAIISPKEMRWQWQYLGSLGSAIASACCTQGTAQRAGRAELSHQLI